MGGDLPRVLGELLPAVVFTAPSHRLSTVRLVEAKTDRLIFVTGSDCHLCDHSRDVLNALQLRRREIGVDGDEAAALGARGIPLAFLPVLTDGERVLAYGRFSEKRLRRELEL
jgi:hypothetical protein